MFLGSSCQGVATCGLYLILLSRLWVLFASGDVCSCQPNRCNLCPSSGACTKINVALNKSASASSLYNSIVLNVESGPPCLAVNGDTNTTFRPINRFYNNSACVMTDPSDYYPYWEVDLGQQYIISTITVYGREETWNTLRNATVTVDDKPCYTFAPDYFRPIITQITCSSSLSGHKVRIKKVNDADRTYFAVCQVQVWVCKSGYYDPNCTNTCGNCSGGTCDPSSGKCPQGCSAGYQPPYCKQVCSTGSHGVNCSNKCGNCSEGSTCNVVSGKCPLGCKPGYQEPYCDVLCTPGSYGLNCSNTCGNCSDGLTCNAVSGECPGGCEPGYQGTQCKEFCRPDTHGADCKEVCGRCTKNSSCDIFNGRCVAGCEPGYQLPLCTEVCSIGFYGPNCSNTCGSCREETSCNAVSGGCPQGCKPGYQGTNCKQTCRAGTYGVGCKETCGICTGNSPCHVSDGRCETGCAAGYQPPTCKSCSQSDDTDRVSASCAGPVAGAVVGSCAVCTLGFVLAIVLMRYRHRHEQDKRPSAACFSAQLKTVHDEGSAVASSLETELSTDFENTTMSTNVYDSLTVSRDKTSTYTTLAVKRAGDVRSSPYVNIT